MVAVPDTTPTLVLSPPTLVFAPEGRPLSVDCVVDGNPAPKVRWLHNSVEVTNGDRVSVKSNGTLHFALVTLGDGGLYLCQGTNTMGSISSGYMTLQVTRKLHTLSFTFIFPFIWRRNRLFIFIKIHTCSYYSKHCLFSPAGKCGFMELV